MMRIFDDASVGVLPPLTGRKKKKSSVRLVRDVWCNDVLFWNGLAKLGRGVRRESAISFRPREAGEGDHWSSRSERTVVEGAHDSELRRRCRTVKADKLDSLKGVK
jgi:hypothetical protein